MVTFVFDGPRSHMSRSPVITDWRSMIFFSIGLPSTFAEWCDAVLVQAVRQQAGDSAFAAVNSLEDLALATLRTKTADLVAGSRQPSIKLCKALAENDLHFVLTVTDPRIAVRDMIAAHGYDLASAVRGIASSAASIRRLAALPGALIFRVVDEGKDPCATARAICDHLDLAVSNEDVHRIVTDLAAAGIGPGAGDIDVWWSGVSDAERNLVNGALGCYAGSPDGEEGVFTFGSALFFLGDAPTNAPIQAIDITGRARCLLYGPFMNIPEGYWNVHVALACSKEAGGIGLIIEVFAGAPLGQVKVQTPIGGGIFDANLNFAIQSDYNSADHPFQVRIFNERAVFDGRLGLGNVTLTAQTRARTEIAKELASSLGLKNH